MKDIHFNDIKIIEQRELTMEKSLQLEILPYPKGDNKRYDSSYKPQTQELLF